MKKLIILLCVFAVQSSLAMELDEQQAKKDPGQEEELICLLSRDDSISTSIIVKDLLEILGIKEEHVDINQEVKGILPLQRALNNNNPRLASMLLALGADPNAKSSQESRPPLVIIADKPNNRPYVNVACKLFTNGGELDNSDNDGRSFRSICRTLSKSQPEKKKLLAILENMESEKKRLTLKGWQGMDPNLKCQIIIYSGAFVCAGVFALFLIVINL